MARSKGRTDVVKRSAALRLFSSSESTMKAHPAGVHYIVDTAQRATRGDELVMVVDDDGVLFVDRLDSVLIYGYTIVGAVIHVIGRKLEPTN